MADDVRQLLLQIDATTALLRSNLSRAEREIANWETGTKKRLDSVDRRFETVGSGLRRLEAPLNSIKNGFTNLAAAAGVLGVGAAARTFLQYADTAKQLDAQLRLATQGTGDFAQATADVQKIANETRSDLSSVAALYGNFVRAGSDLGRTQEDAARATETFQKALALGGGSAQDAANATRQFNQALAGGVLRAEEFNSIVEASPRVQRLLAEALGVSTGKLRELVNEGKVSSQQLFEALTNKDYTAKIDREFTQLPVTFDQAMTLVRNAAVTTFGAFDEGGQFSTALAEFIGRGTDGFASLGERAGELGIDIRAALDGLSSAFDPLLAGGNGAFDTLEGRLFDLRNDIAAILGVFDDIRNISIDTGNLERRAENFVLRQVGAKEQPLTPRSDVAGDFVERFDASRRNRRFNARFGGRLTLSTSDGEPAPTATTPRASGGSGQTDAQRRAAARRAEAAARKAEREAEQAARRDAAVADEIGRINIEIARRAADLSGSIQTRAEVERAAAEFERASQARRIEVDRDLTQAQRTELIAANERRAASERAAIDEQERRDLEQERFALESAGNRGEAEVVASRVQLARTAEQRLALELRLIDLAYSQEEAELRNIMATNAVGTARYQEAQALLARLDERKANDELGSRERNASPLRAFLLSMPQSIDEMEERLELIAANSLDRLNDDLADALLGVGSLEDAFENLAKSIIRDLARIAIQQAIIKPIAESLFGSGGAGGNVFGSLAKLFGSGGPGYGGAKALGGPVRAGSSYLVGENGPERFVPRVAGQIIPTRMLMPQIGAPAGASTVQTVKVITEASPYFDTRVEQVAGSQLAQAAPAIAEAGRDAAISELTRQRI